MRSHSTPGSANSILSPAPTWRVRSSGRRLPTASGGSPGTPDRTPGLRRRARVPAPNRADDLRHLRRAPGEQRPVPFGPFRLRRLSRGLGQGDDRAGLRRQPEHRRSRHRDPPHAASRGEDARAGAPVPRRGHPGLGPGQCQREGLQEGAPPQGGEEALRPRGRRGLRIPGGVRSGIGVGIFVSLATGATPTAREPWGLANGATARALATNARLGGPRCCKRTGWLALLTGVRFSHEQLGARIGGRGPACEFSGRNAECLERRCPFRSARRQAAG